jgi:hypothetical protein
MHPSQSSDRRLIIGNLILWLIWTLTVPLSALAAESNDHPFGTVPIESTWSVPIRFFQETISRADGNRCAMHPSCSHYAFDVFKHHGFFTAWTLTSDRLLRCGHDEIRLAPRIVIHGELKAYDPIAANTFWWGKP